ncbi:MAG: bifunctional proline dehydrogenase/L-glutamate gamma-semialdehyde dehydrogenase PutA [Pseudohongiellaceae bacterium]
MDINLTQPDTHSAEVETELVASLVRTAALDRPARTVIGVEAATLVTQLRTAGEQSFLDVFLAEYGLTNDEGVALLSMAEAFLRVPDADTLDQLLREKLTGSDWQSHSGHASSFLVNASTWALLLTGRLLSRGEARGLADSLRGMLQRLGEPVLRTAMTEAMARMGDHFVIGENIDQALRRAGQAKHAGSYFSFDMLGEAARTEADAQAYLQSYQNAIAALADTAGPDVDANPGISVKLSALHPRFEWLQRERSFAPLQERLTLLAEQAAACNVGLSIDAEEQHRLDYTLALFERVARDLRGRDWQGLGLVVQAYARRAPEALDRIEALARELDTRFPVRLVKGAYWDTEIKRAQTLGLAHYPVFTRKCHTDVSYLAAARRLLRLGPLVYPQFATHNAHTMMAVRYMAAAEGHEDWEFQRLYGMGAALHERVRKEHGTRHRIYAPVGEHEDLLAYLVRRLLENGANSSFVHQITDRDVAVAEVVADPLARAEALAIEDKEPIPPPAQLYGERRNSRGWELGHARDLECLLAERARYANHVWQTRPLLAGKNADEKSDEKSDETERIVSNPARPDDRVGSVEFATAETVTVALDAARTFQSDWSARPVAERSRLLLITADLLQERPGEILALLTREAGKTLADAVSEWREAIDFLRYYAQEATQQQGEARGVFVCISPWNFPLAIFTGQVAAALVTGNVVLAKPAEQTPLIAGRMIELLHEAGVPRAALQLLPGEGDVGAALCRDDRVSGVCFTGSLATAKAIDRAMAAHLAPHAALIAETGGINAMLIDSTALPEQAVEDIITSAFGSAGQRCSALRILYLQEEVAERILTMLKGAMDALKVGDPWQESTDVGPLIDDAARTAIEQALERRPLSHCLSAPEEGFFLAPRLLEVSGIADIKEELFGPVLFVARYRADELSRVLDDINAAGYGLTFAMHSRLVTRTERCGERLRIGNLYINRNQVGAVVQSQPFGGEGLSGTGPKAGGPCYLSAFQRHAPRPASGEESAALTERIEPDLLRAALTGLDNSSWSARKDRLSLVSSVLPAPDGLEHLPQPGSVMPMPGPTGERNRYHLVPLTRVLCLGPGMDALRAQVALALAAGCGVVACGADVAEAVWVQELRESGAPLMALDGQVSLATLAELAELEALCWWGAGAQARDLRQAVAARAGGILRFIGADSFPSRFFHERHVCNDTTRAGGNIELMAK